MILDTLMNNFFSSKVVDDIWLPLLVSTFSGVLVSLLVKSNETQVSVRVDQRADHRRHRGLTLTDVRQLIQEEIIKVGQPSPGRQPSRTQAGNSTNGDDGPIAMLCGLILLAGVYAQYQQVILYYSVIAAISLFGFWIASVTVSVLGGILVGRDWIVYATSVCILTMLALPILYLSTHPIYAPAGITTLQSVTDESGLIGLVNKFGAEGLSFIVFQVVGFLIMYGAWVLILLTLMFMSASALVAMGSRGRRFWLWLSIKTSKFGNPIGMTLFSFALYVVAFLFISGIANEWVRTFNQV